MPDVPDAPAAPSWVVTLHPNPKDTHPVTFAWSGGELVSSDKAMRAAVVRLADRVGELAPTPTGPFVPADLAVPYVAYALVCRLATMAGLLPGEIEVQGTGWQWPALEPVPGAVY